MYQHILIPTDGSDFAAKGVEQGLEFAQKAGARVTVIVVTEPLSEAAAQAAITGGIGDPVGRYETQMDLKVKEMMAPVERRASELGVAIEIVRETDASPAEAIVRAARLRGCDLIVMASHGRRGLKKLMLGSQTSEVLVHTTLPVLVIR